MPKRRVTRKKPIKTPRKRRQKTLARKKGRKSGVVALALAGLAHDIRTPLSGMLAMSDLLLTSGLPERERGWAAAIKDAAWHLARLTTLVVDAAKAGGRASLGHEPFMLGAFVDSVAQSLRARAEGKSLAVEIGVGENLPARVAGDAVRLRSALENLIDNAVKFTEHGTVSLSVTAKQLPRKRVRLTFAVSDTGIGIVTADLKRLFKPFVQANEDVAPRFGGSGLGLAFVKQIAEAMGGGITAQSVPGAGSTFSLTAVFDVVEAEHGAATPKRSAVRPLRVLCVEDNPYGRVVLNTVLGELGHEVAFAETGEAAIVAVERGGYDIVLMDVALPGIDGFETARRIRALSPPAGHTPIIGVSGRTGDSDEEMAWDAGMDTYLRKPASPATLNEALAAAVAPEPKRRRL